MQPQPQSAPVSRRPARFTQSDVSRAIKAVEAAGASMVIEIMTDGTIRIAPANMSSPSGRPDPHPSREIKL
jgi:hypothetical protein